MNRSALPEKLNLKAGEWIEVRSREEILSTLDERGCHQKTPLMPEMLQYCGKRFRVYKRADKTCDPAHEPWSIRRLRNTVHLEELRCDGQAHGGCQAGCLIFWKEIWLKRVDGNLLPVENLRPGSNSAHQAFFSIEQLLAASSSKDSQGDTVYSCQAISIRDYTYAMAPWDPRQYVRDLTSGNLNTGLSDGTFGNRLLEFVLGLFTLVRALTISLFNLVPRRIKGAAYPFVVGTLEKTPVETLGLQAGEFVEVRSKEEIVATLDKHNRNRGMLFDGEMLPYCGGIYRVLRRVDHIIDERSGKMMYMKSPCIILDGAVCRSDYHRLCPRAIYPYWRENWLKRASNTATPTQQVTETCEKAC